MFVLYGDLSRLKRTSRYGRKIRPFAELRLEIREQLGHRPQNEVLVVALVILPVRLRIVGLETLEEREGLG